MRTRACALSVVALLAAGLTDVPAVAQTGIPTRIGNTWNWRHHEPYAPAVREAERSARIAPMPGQREAGTAEVEGLYQHLIRRSPF